MASSNVTIKGSRTEERAIPHIRVDDDSAIEQMFYMGKKLGQGAFGIVREAVNQQTGKKWAVKAINKEKAGSSAVKLLEREVSILKRVEHKSIIHLDRVFETPKKMYLVMELCEHGELAELLKEREKFPEEEAIEILKDLASAITYLHKNDIVHRDLKLENILVSQKNSEEKLQIKLTDFGLSVVKDGVGHENMMQQFCGTPMYMSPEIIDEKKSYSQQCDVWALGVILYYLLSGNAPFKARNEEALYEMINEGRLNFEEPCWDDISEDAKNLIMGMMKVDPAHRLTASEILNHNWITGDHGGAQPANVLELMKQWKDELKVQDDEGAGEDNSDEPPSSTELLEPPTGDSQDGLKAKKKSSGTGSGGKSRPRQPLNNNGTTKNSSTGVPNRNHRAATATSSGRQLAADRKSSPIGTKFKKNVAK